MSILYQLCDELQVQIVAKRHCQSGLWDMRLTHFANHGPVMTSAGKLSPTECLADLEERAPRHLENSRVFLERKNKERQQHQNKDTWHDVFWKE